VVDCISRKDEAMVRFHHLALRRFRFLFSFWEPPSLQLCRTVAPKALRGFAQLVTVEEHFLGTEKVVGSIPTLGSLFSHRLCGGFCVCKRIVNYSSNTKSQLVGIAWLC
jgi:hypothetical protein